MTYLSRKEAPLFFNGLVKFIFLPLGMVLSGAVFALFLMFMSKYGSSGSFVQSFQIYSGFFYVDPQKLLIALLIVGCSLGLCFAVNVLAWLKMLRWRRSGKNLWLLMNVIVTAAVIAAAVMSGRMISTFRANTEFTEFYSMMLGYSRSDFLALLGVLMAAAWVIGIVSAVWTVLNFVYYYKRRKLFAPFYAEPLEELPAAAAEAEPASEENRQSEEGRIIPEEVIPAAPAPKLLFCPECGRKLTEEDTEVCSECGRKLVNE